jgi:tetratricopeptide (TPR) repeat protein
MNNLALAYSQAGRREQCLALLEETVRLKQARLGPESLDTLTSVYNLAVEYKGAGKYAEAVPMYRKWLASERRRLPAGDPVLTGTLTPLGVCLLRSGQPAEAEPVLRESLALGQKKRPDSWVTFDAQSLLGDALRAQAKYADAEPLLKEGYEGLKQRQDKILHGPKAHVAEALERLVRLYDAWGKPEEAARRRTELEAARGDAKAPAGP